MRLNRRACAALAALGLAVAVPASAGAWENEKSHCNAGNGNGSDEVTFTPGEHCYGGDPGNSYNAGNRGGDEIPTSNGVSNPGGNNVP
jgi:hypothetical protein